MDWKNLFDAEILNRGLDYYEQDLVVRFQKRGREIRAEVSGNEIYTVEISIADDTVIDMYCSCPYAADGNNCKHMAAVLFYAEDDIPKNDIIPGTTDEIHDTESAIDELVNTADGAKVKNFFDCCLKRKSAPVTAI